MKAKHQRLALVGAAVVALVVAAMLAIPALKSQTAYFISPGDLAGRKITPGQMIRLGGLVETGSLAKSRDGLTIFFRVTDHRAHVAVRYTGIVPDLFREGQGMIADGAFDAAGVFAATTLLAKHDENYMPPEVARAVAKAEAKARDAAEERSP